MNRFKKFAAGLTALSVAATMASCGTPTIGAGSANALTIDGYEVRAGVFIFYTLSAYYEAQQIVAGGNTSTVPTPEDVEDSLIDDIESVDWIQDKATEYCQNYVTIQKEFEKVGGELSAEDLKTIEDTVEQYKSYEIYTENGIGEESVRDIISLDYKREVIFEHYYGFEGEKGVSEDELKDYFDENFARVKYVKLSLTNADGEKLEDSDVKDIRDLADEYAERINAKDDTLDKMYEMDAVQDDYDEYVEEYEAAHTTTTTGTGTETTTTTTTTTTDASATTTTTNPYANEVLLQKKTTTTAAADVVVTETGTTTTPSAASKSMDNLNEFVFDELKADNKAVVFDDEDNDAIYVVIRADLRERMTDDDLWDEDSILYLQNLRFGTDFEDFMTEISESLTVDRNKSAYRRYEPFKLMLETEA